jgi:hypothetical protein
LVGLLDPVVVGLAHEDDVAKIPALIVSHSGVIASAVLICTPNVRPMKVERWVALDKANRWFLATGEVTGSPGQERKGKVSTRRVITWTRQVEPFPNAVVGRVSSKRILPKVAGRERLPHVMQFHGKWVFTIAS